MLVFEISINRIREVVAGCDDLSVMSALVTLIENYGGDGTDESGTHAKRLIGLQVSGRTTGEMTDSCESLHWIQFRELLKGDEVSLRIVESETADEPSQREPVDKVTAGPSKKRYEEAKSYYLKHKHIFEPDD